MNIGLDFDGVISDCGRLKSEGAKKLFGIDIAPSKFKRELVIGGGLLSEPQYRELQKVIYATRETGLAMQPVSEAFLYLPKILSDGHLIKVVTSRNAESLDIAKEWTKQYGVELEFIGVGYANNKRAAADGLDIFIDDDLDKLIPLMSAVPHLFLYSWGYNQHINTGSMAIRVSSWKEIYQHIQSLSSFV